MAWESLVRVNPASGFMQSLYWAEVKRRQGLSSLHVGMFENAQLVGGTTFYSYPKRNGVGILVAPEGPVLPWQNTDLATESLRLIMDTARAYATDSGIMAMRIEPRLVPPLPRLLREFSRAPVNLVPRDTLYIDISPAQEQLLDGMKAKGRYNIALAERHGVTVVEEKSRQGVNAFYSVLKEASRRDGFALEPISFFESLAAVLCPAGHAKFLFATHEGDLLGTALLITYGERATYLYGGISNQKRNLMGGYALQWAAMNASKEAGCSIYDFYGIDAFRAPEHRYARFSQFKSQFGGEVLRFIGAHDYFFLDNLADAFVKAVREVRPAASKKASKETSPEEEDTSELNLQSFAARQECLV
jgi:lipid II:glycine glycyltransferase (peptidoglycan interpeptide bridge formation enzyme)